MSSSVVLHHFWKTSPEMSGMAINVWPSIDVLGWSFHRTKKEELKILPEPEENCVI